MKTPSCLYPIALLFLAAGAAHGDQKILIDFGNAATYRGVTAPSPDANGNHWNSVGYGYVGNMVDTTGAATRLDWAPDGLGGVDSYNGPAGATSNPVVQAEIDAADAAIDNVALGDLGVAEAAIDFFVSSNGTTGVGRFQIQQVFPGQVYDLVFYGSRKFTGTDTQTTYKVFSDNTYTTLLGSVTLTHGDGAANHNADTVATISGIVGPSNTNNVLYIQWEGTVTSTAGYLNAMELVAVSPAPSAGQEEVLIDFGNDATYRSASVPSPDANGNHWNSVGTGYVANLVDTAGAVTDIDWAPAGLGGIDSYNGPAGATTDPVTATQITAAGSAINKAALGSLGAAEAAIDYYVSSNATTNVGRFQIQQLTEGQLYDLSFYGSHKYTGTNTQTVYKVFDDPDYTNLIGSVTLTHGDGAAGHNPGNVATIAGLLGPAYPRIFYVQWEGAVDTTKGYLNAMRINYTSLDTPVVHTVLGGATMTLAFMSQADVSYQLQVNLSLDSNNWTDDGAPVAGDGTQKQFVRTAPGSGKVFYRLKATQTGM